MLKAAGEIDDRWFTQQSRDRGTAVHHDVADISLGAIKAVDVPERLRGYAAAYEAVLVKERPEILTVEEPRVHPVYRYGGRPDLTLRYKGSGRYGRSSPGSR